MIQKNYQEDIQVFDDIEAEALAMSDMIASAIVMHFVTSFINMYKSFCFPKLVEKF